MKLPKFVHGFIDRHGRPRYYLRRRGFTKLTLPGLAWSPQFMAAYEAGLTNQPTIDPGRGNIRPGTMRALVASFVASGDFRALKPQSQQAYRYTLENFCKKTDQ